MRVGDIGSAYNSVENDKVAAWYVNQRSIILAVQRQPGTNTVEVAKGVKNLLPLMQAQLPASVSMHVLYDASTSIEESVQDVKFTLLFTLVLVVLVIFIFLRRLPYTVIPSTAMPMSLVGTFIVMYLMGYNIDNLSLMALILAVGFVVDDAIVMLENIVRHLEMGEGPVKAALNGSREIGFTIVSMTLSLVAVFIPILFMGGILGRIFQEFAVTIGAAILISGLVSLTLTPMLCSRFLKAHAEHPPGRLFNASERVYEAMLSLYRRSLGWFLDHRRITIGILVLVVGGTVVLLRLVPRGFIPSEDRAIVYGPTEAAEGISFEAMKRLQQALAEVVRQDPNVEAFMSNAGSRPGGIAGGNTGSLFLRLKPASRARAHGRPGHPEPAPQARPGAGDPGFPAEPAGHLRRRPGDQEPIPVHAAGHRRRGALSLGAPGGGRRPGAARVHRRHDRPAAAQPAGQHRHQPRQGRLAGGFGRADRGRALQRLRLAADLDHLRGHEPVPGHPRAQARVPAGRRRALAALRALVFGRAGAPGRAGAHQPGVRPAVHQPQRPAALGDHLLQPAAGVRAGRCRGRAEPDGPRHAAGHDHRELPGHGPGVRVLHPDSGLLLVVAVLVIYIVLGILYESFIHPVTILSALPLAGLGALFTLYIFNAQLDIYSFVGLILLVGLVKKNGIIMIDFALELQRVERKSPREAIFEACIVRFRPIMMTTFAALVGTIPIAVGWGAGGESRQPLGLAVVGGLFFSQMLTLFVTPVFYLYMDGLQRRFRSRVRTVEAGQGA